MKWIFRLLPVFLFILLVKKIKPEKICWYGNTRYYMPYKDILIKDKEMKIREFYD